MEQGFSMEYTYILQLCSLKPILVAERSNASVYGRSLSGIAGSNSSGSIMFVSCEYCVLSGRDDCVGPIARPEESY